MHAIKLFVVCFFVGILAVSAQDLPPIVKYPSAAYGAGNQNWMVAQDAQHFVFFANNEGLLEFNGANWTLYPSPNETILRSVRVIGNRIYTGCYMEFGFWQRGADGQLRYRSLSSKIKSKLLDDEQFWNILDYDQWVIFQSLNRIYIYDSKADAFNIITRPGGIWKTFKTDNGLFFQSMGEGLFEIENGKPKLLSTDALLRDQKLVNIFQVDDGLLLQTAQWGFFKLSGGLSKFPMPADPELAGSTIYASQRLADGSFALGTVSNGIFILSSDGRTRYHMTQNRGLSNNTALSVFEDADRNLWLGLDNGINCINLQSPVRSFSDDTGLLGTVYAARLREGKLYVGTNQGLFYRQYETADDFHFVPGTKGQVWSLYEYGGSLLCGHDSGTFLVDGPSARLVFAQSGTWKFEPVPGHPDLLLQGNYYGLSVLQRSGNGWAFRNKVSGFDYSSKYFEITAGLEVYVSHEYKGVFRMQLDRGMMGVQGKFFTYDNPPKGKNASLAKFHGDIYYAYKGGIFKLDPKTRTFAKDAVLSRMIGPSEFTSGKMIMDRSNKLWVFSRNYIHYVTSGKMSDKLRVDAIPIPASLTNSMLGYENIAQLNHSNYLIGTTDGYYTLNLNELGFKNYSVAITSVDVNRQNEKATHVPLFTEGELRYDLNNLTFNYSVPEYNKYISAEYQYLLEGAQDQWSDWSTRTSAGFKNLPPGDYVFRVRAKIANSTPENVAEYRFTINKPWYATHLALLVYFILLLVAAHFIHKAYKQYYQKQREKLIEENNLLLEIKELENEQQLMKLRNEQLSQDVDAKNRELAVSTMSLIKKNELLSVIKEDLKKTEDSSRNIKSVISTINRNINEEDTWNVFKEAFDNADKDFLKKIKQAHPSLTPNDLRLCAYLRLNLSSKEIAPLVNISVRSVEIKRYRLRKKMELLHDQGLVEYILSI